MSGDDDELAPRGAARTVIVSAGELAALTGDGRPTPDTAPAAVVDPFAAPARDPFGVAVDNRGGAGVSAAGSGVPSDPFATAAPVDPFASATAPPPTDPIAATTGASFAATTGVSFAATTGAPADRQPSAPGAFVHGTPGGLVGMHLNDLFEIVGFIAQGGMGEVYEGRNLASGERVAIKVILPQYAADAAFMALFRREASALERIGHDSLVKYRTLAFDRTNRINYLAIEFVNGPSLADVLTGEPADPAMVRRVLKRLATGLGAAHEAGVIHRDLSPDNLLLPDGKIERSKIIDFGIAKDTNPGEKSVVGEAFAGKFGYAAPEIFGKFKRAVGPWTDVYSLALVMIAFARGSPLDMGVTIVDALEARDTVPDLSAVPPDLQPVFAKMLAPDPAERFRSMDEVIAALDAPAGSFAPAAIFGGGDAPATTLPPRETAAAPAFVRATTAAPAAVVPAKKSSLPLYGGIAAAVLLLAGGGYALLGGKKDVPPTAATEPATASAGAPDAASPAAVVASPSGATPAAAPSSAASWESIRPQVLAALAAVPCSDLRVEGTPAAGSVHLAGWRPRGATLPFGPAGWTLDGGGAAEVDAPSAATCALVAKLHAAVPPDASGFAVPGVQHIKLATARKAADGSPLVNLHPDGVPADRRRLLIATIDDGATSAAGRVVSADVNDAKVDLAALGFDPKPGRYLTVLVAGGDKLPPVTAAGADALRDACGANGCTMTSGWVEIER